MITLGQFLTNIRQRMMRQPTKPIRVRPSGYAPSTRVSGQKLYPGSTSTLRKSKFTKYIP